MEHAENIIHLHPDTVDVDLSKVDAWTTDHMYANLFVFRDGQLLRYGGDHDYTISGGVLKFNFHVRSRDSYTLVLFSPSSLPVRKTTYGAYCENNSIELPEEMR